MDSLQNADLTDGYKEKSEPSQHREHREATEEREGGGRREGGREDGRGGEGRGGERCRFIVRLTAYSKAITTYFSFLVLPSPKIRLST
jgi:hypothetical protein